MKAKKRTLIAGFFWKMMERIGVQGGQFVLQIILARLLDADHYGTLSLMVVFTNLANVFIQRGFSSALVQNRDVTEEDYSSVFWITLAVAAVIYAGLWVCAPLIAVIYKMPDIVAPFRVLTLILFPGAINSIQLAKVKREMDFKKIFYSNVAGIFCSGVISIVIAFCGGGLWALVANNLINTVVACIVMRYTVAWRIRFVCNLERVKVLFSFGWKLLVSHLINTLYQDIRGLIVGIKYDSGTLGYYNRGKHFPQFLINTINNTVQSVMLPAMSAEQDDQNQLKSMMRKSISVSAYILFPMMAGLAAVAEPLITLLLTEKWLPAVPYMQIYCFTLAFYPVHSCNLQAINAMGRSDIYLKLEVVKKCYGLGTLAIAVFFFDSPLAIAATGVVTTLISTFVNAFPNQKLIGYTYLEQLQDMLPSLLASLVMCGVVLAVKLLGLNAFVTLVIQILVGVVLYVGISAAAGLEPFKMILKLLKGFRKKKS